MTKVEILKTKAELLRVQGAKAEMQYIIAQREEEIARLMDAISKQEETEVVLLNRLEEGSVSG